MHSVCFAKTSLCYAVAVVQAACPVCVSDRLIEGLQHQVLRRELTWAIDEVCSKERPRDQASDSCRLQSTCVLGPRFLLWNLCST